MWCSWLLCGCRICVTLADPGGNRGRGDVGNLHMDTARRQHAGAGGFDYPFS
jgi:hypothetical protein